MATAPGVGFKAARSLDTKRLTLDGMSKRLRYLFSSRSPTTFTSQSNELGLSREKCSPSDRYSSTSESTATWASSSDTFEVFEAFGAFRPLPPTFEGLVIGGESLPKEEKGISGVASSSVRGT